MLSNDTCIIYGYLNKLENWLVSSRMCLNSMPFSPFKAKFKSWKPWHYFTLTSKWPSINQVFEPFVGPNFRQLVLFPFTWLGFIFLQVFSINLLSKLWLQSDKPSSNFVINTYPAMNNILSFILAGNTGINQCTARLWGITKFLNPLPEEL